MARVHGKNGTVFIGATHFPVNSFDFEYSVELEDVTYSRIGGTSAVDREPGLETATGTLNFIYDTAAKPTVAPQQMKPGTLLTLNLKPDGTDTFSFQAYSGRFRFSSGPRAGMVKCSTSFESTGPIASPTS